MKPQLYTKTNPFSPDVIDYDGNNWSKQYPLYNITINKWDYSPILTDNDYRTPDKVDRKYKSCRSNSVFKNAIKAVQDSPIDFDIPIHMVYPCWVKSVQAAIKNPFKTKREATIVYDIAFWLSSAVEELLCIYNIPWWFRINKGRETLEFWPVPTEFEINGYQFICLRGLGGGMRADEIEELIKTDKSIIFWGGIAYKVIKIPE